MLQVLAAALAAAASTAHGLKADDLSVQELTRQVRSSPNAARRTLDVAVHA
jgi:hypothetical protein